MRPLLCPVAADFHLAPAALLVLRSVEEQPAATVAAATLLDARDVALCQQRQGGERDRSENGFNDSVSRAPGPDKIAAERRQLGMADARGMDATERVDIGCRRCRAMRDGAADAI